MEKVTVQFYSLRDDVSFVTLKGKGLLHDPKTLLVLEPNESAIPLLFAVGAGKVTVQDLVDILRGAYGDIPAEQAQGDVQALLNQLSESGLLIEESLHFGFALTPPSFAPYLEREFPTTQYVAPVLTMQSRVNLDMALQVPLVAVVKIIKLAPLGKIESKIKIKA